MSDNFYDIDANGNPIDFISERYSEALGVSKDVFNKYAKDNNFNSNEAYLAMRSEKMPKEKKSITKDNLLSSIREALPDREVKRPSVYEPGVPLKEQLAKVIRDPEGDKPKKDLNDLLSDNLKRGI